MTINQTIEKVVSIKPMMVLCIVAILSFSCTLCAATIDTIKTNNDGMLLLLGEDEIAFKKENLRPKHYYRDLAINQEDSIKLLIDSCLWQKYYNGEIKEGHCRFLCFILLNKNWKIDEVCFSEPFSTSGEVFYRQVTSAIRKIVEENSFYLKRKSKGHDKINRYYCLLYKINLYP